MKINLTNKTVSVIKGKWYKSNGQPLSDEEKDLVQQEISQELDAELANHGFEGFIKKMIKWVLNFLAK